MSNLHVWYNTASPGWAEAAFVLINTGGKDVVLQSITARSQPSTWANIYYNSSNTWTVTTLYPTASKLSSSNLVAPVNGTYGTTPSTVMQVKLTNAAGVITLKSGYTLVVYIMQPDSVGQNDVGTPVAVTVFTANAQWTQESNVQAAQ
jgi:hypothetical protein